MNVREGASDAPVILASLITGYAEMVADRIADGWQASLLTVKFHPLRGGPRAVLRQMTDEIERVYSTFLTHVVRNPRASSSIDRLPVLIACADLPVAKRDKKSVMDVTINGGLHFHGILLVPPASRLKETVEAHFAAERHLYLLDRGRLADIRVEPIEHDPGRVVDYILKSVRNGRLQYDDALLVLPRASGELE